MEGFFINWKDFLFDSGELLIILMLLNFFKLIIWSSFFELLWPTHFFNKKNNIFFTSIRFRNFVEFVSKFRIINHNYNIFSKSFLIFFFIKGKLMKTDKIRRRK